MKDFAFSFLVVNSLNKLYDFQGWCEQCLNVFFLAAGISSVLQLFTLRDYLKKKKKVFFILVPIKEGLCFKDYYFELWT